MDFGIYFPNRDINNSQEITKDSITAALNIEATIDNRLIAAAFSEGARDSLVKTMKNSPENLANALLQNGELIDGTINLVSRAALLIKYI